MKQRMLLLLNVLIALVGATISIIGVSINLMQSSAGVH